MSSDAHQLVVPDRFHGPPGSGNGGWSSGALSEVLRGAAAVAVRLSAPPPLDRPMAVEVETSDGRPVRATARDDDTVVLTAAAIGPDEAAALTPVDPVPPDVARAAAGAYRGLVEHPFPSCFVCGLDRAEGDGLRLTPGVLPGTGDRTACEWSPGDDVDVPQTWASVDCPGGWSTDLVGRPMVLGGITVALHRVPRPGERCVVTGLERGTEGRKTRTAATLWSFDDDREPELLATAEHLWIAVDPSAFGTSRR